MLIRPATAEDLAAIAQVFRASFSTALPHIRLHTPEEDIEYFGANVLPVDTVLVAVEPGAGVHGFVAYSSGRVNHLYVAPPRWRSGIGRALLDRAKASSPVLQLWTFQANTNARAFYRSQGFREVRQTDGHGNEEQEPDVLLEWRA